MDEQQVKIVRKVGVVKESDYDVIRKMIVLDIDIDGREKKIGLTEECFTFGGKDVDEEMAKTAYLFKGKKIGVELTEDQFLKTDEELISLSGVQRR